MAGAEPGAKIRDKGGAGAKIRDKGGARAKKKLFWFRNTEKPYFFVTRSLSTKWLAF